MKRAILTDSLTKRTYDLTRMLEEKKASGTDPIVTIGKKEDNDVVLGTND